MDKRDFNALKRPKVRIETIIPIDKIRLGTRSVKLRHSKIAILTDTPIETSKLMLDSDLSTIIIIRAPSPSRDLSRGSDCGSRQKTKLRAARLRSEDEQRSVDIV